MCRNSLRSGRPGGVLVVGGLWVSWVVVALVVACFFVFGGSCLCFFGCFF